MVLVGWATIISTKDTRDGNYYSELESMMRFPVLKLLAYVLLGGFVGCFVRYALWCSIVSSENISLPLIFMFITMSALVILWAHGKNTTGKLILLFGTFVISLSILWILLFNLLNVLIPHSPLRICVLLRG